jgi:DNA polymerase-4
MGAQRALGFSRTGSPHSLATLDASLAGLVDRVTRRMRAAERHGRTVTLRLRFDDFSRVTRAHTLPKATAHTQTILDAARDLLTVALPLIAERGCTLIGVSVGNLDSTDAEQLLLPLDAFSGTSLDCAVDAVRNRFGSAALTRGALVGAGTGMEMPMLPD